MKGIENITNKIIEDAQSEAGRILDEANTQADGILSAARAEADARARDAINAAQADRDKLEHRAESMAELEVRKMKLADKQKLIGEAFELAKKQIYSLPSDKYSSFLVRMAIDAAVDGGELIFSTADRSKYGKQVTVAANKQLESKGIKLKLSVETRDIPGGIIVRSGQVETNCSLEALLDAAREELSGDVAKMLF